MELSKIARTKRGRFIRNRLLPLSQGCPEGEWSVVNNPALCYDHIERCFGYANARVYLLPADQSTDSGNWVNSTGKCSGRRRHLPIEIIATYLGIHWLSSSPKPVTAYRITGECDLIPEAEVTGTDALRSLIGEEATHLQGRGTTRDAIHEIVRNPKKRSKWAPRG